ncbi:hypothetical protein H7K45_06260 [Mycobacterium yunnanensis]|uniref:Homeodomain-like domain-containing protein n=1 Tax=Mycobacterium yunnanensis TaxID=368477 RepID=A0A9X2YZ07_9MYCO|nr:hypothetical protein [Mycobacterium yunnanensis]
MDLDAARSAEPGDSDGFDDLEDLLVVEDEPEDPDPVMVEFLVGRCRAELGVARDVLADAKMRYDAAVLGARAAGYSWGEIGNVLGVSKQQLHRRFRTRQRGRP